MTVRGAFGFEIRPNAFDSRRRSPESPGKDPATTQFDDDPMLARGLHAATDARIDEVMGY
jgi:hypothetical protein